MVDCDCCSLFKRLFDMNFSWLLLGTWVLDPEGKFENSSTLLETNTSSLKTSCEQSPIQARISFSQV